MVSNIWKNNFHFQINNAMPEKKYFFQTLHYLVEYPLIKPLYSINKKMFQDERKKPV